MAVDVRLEGGPRDGAKERLDDENHLAVVYPGYTPVSAESDPERGLVMVAQWSGTEAQEAAYQTPVLNVMQAASEHDHSQEDAEPAPNRTTDEQAQQEAATEQQEPQGAPQPPPEAAQATEGEQVDVQHPEEQQNAHEGAQAPVPPVPEVPEAPVA